MSRIIYGLRIVGDVECRYVGMATKPHRRFTEHMAQAKMFPQSRPFFRWMADNNVEFFEIARAETLDDAREAERAVVAIMLRLNHRLFNFCLVPRDRRQLEAA